MSDSENVIRFPPLSVLNVEFEIPKAVTNRIVETAEHPAHPIYKMDAALKEFLKGFAKPEEIRLIGFTIND